jgi:hypothetical protein
MPLPSGVPNAHTTAGPLDLPHILDGLSYVKQGRLCPSGNFHKVAAPTGHRMPLLVARLARGLLQLEFRGSRVAGDLALRMFRHHFHNTKLNPRFVCRARVRYRRQLWK